MDSQEPAVIVQDLYKTFKLPHEQHNGLKQAAISIFRSNRGYEVQKVLNNISFEIKKGEFFGIVGRNGSGKSTLLKLLAGIYVPDKGLIQVNGSLTPFIELGVGFNPELTGRENIFLNGALLGFSKNEMNSMYDDIVEFAELEKFMDQKLKNYSSGMQVRLAFSIAIRADSAILLLDEVLAVGDAVFQKKCFDYFKELKKQRKTVILVSHDANVLREYCTAGILLENGKIVYKGKISQVVMNYLDILNKSEEASAGEEEPGDKNTWGTGEIDIVSTGTYKSNSSKEKKRVFADADADILVRVKFEAKSVADAPVYGITITDAEGRRVFQSNTLWTHTKTETVNENQVISVEWVVPNVFNTGSYFISPAVANRNGSVIYQWRDATAVFKVRKELESSAIINLPHSIKVMLKKD
jgi:ABC-2 type transport system ATP-binding protein